MADEDELLVQVEGEDQTDNENEGHEERPEDVLKAQLDALKADNEKRIASEAAAHRRAADERARADAAAREAAEAKATVADRELDTIVSGIAAAQAEAETAERDFAAAAEAGDFKKQAEAQRRLARAESRATSLETAKADLELRRSSDPGRSREQTRTDASVRTSDPVEDYISQRTERTAEWMRNHRDWITDPKKSAKLTGAHSFAVSEGYIPDTDEYFEYVEKMIGLRQEQTTKPNGAANGQGQQQRTPARRASPVVAPVNGGAGAYSSGAQDNRGPTISLTKGEADRANDGSIVWNKGSLYKGRILDPNKETNPNGWKADAQIVGTPIGNQEYARRKLQGQKDGIYDRMYTHG